MWKVKRGTWSVERKMSVRVFTTEYAENTEGEKGKRKKVKNVVDNVGLGL